MKRLEVSGAVRPIYASLGVKRLTEELTNAPPKSIAAYSPNQTRDYIR